MLKRPVSITSANRYKGKATKVSSANSGGVSEIVVKEEPLEEIIQNDEIISTDTEVKVPRKGCSGDRFTAAQEVNTSDILIYSYLICYPRI